MKAVCEDFAPDDRLVGAINENDEEGADWWSRMMTPFDPNEEQVPGEEGATSSGALNQLD